MPVNGRPANGLVSAVERVWFGSLDGALTHRLHTATAVHSPRISHPSTHPARSRNTGDWAAALASSTTADGASAAKFPHLCFLEGPPGSGKTSLLERMQRLGFAVAQVDPATLQVGIVPPERPNAHVNKLAFAVGAPHIREPIHRQFNQKRDLSQSQSQQQEQQQQQQQQCNRGTVDDCRGPAEQLDALSAATSPSGFSVVWCHSELQKTKERLETAAFANTHFGAAMDPAVARMYRAITSTLRKRRTTLPGSNFLASSQSVECDQTEDDASEDENKEALAFAYTVNPEWVHAILPTTDVKQASAALQQLFGLGWRSDFDDLAVRMRAASAAAHGKGRT